jgi:hypothetical protein
VAIALTSVAGESLVFEVVIEWQIPTDSIVVA